MSRAHARRPRRRLARLATRSLAGLLVLAAVTAGIGFRYWTDPLTVRRLVLERLRLQFPGAEVTLDSARLWPGWGIAVTNLSLSRRDDPTLTPVLQVPTGRIEADAEQLAHGKLRVRRVKLERARITAVRDHAGKWNLDGLLAPPQPSLTLPTIVLERGTIVLRIAAPDGGESAWEVGQVRAAMLEDGARLARFECKGESNRLGPLALEGTWRRDRGHVDLALDLTGIPFNADLIREAARFAPLPVDSIRHCSGVARVHLDAKRRPEDVVAWRPEWRLGLSRGRLGVRELPVDLDALEIDARISDGRLIVKEAHALAADAPVHAMLEARLPPESPGDAVETLAVSTERFLVTPELFARLPEKAQRFQQRFAPVGRMNVTYRYARRKAGGWDARFELKPDNVAGRYHKFPYPLRQVRGTIATDLASDQPSRNRVDISAEVNGGGRVSLWGTVAGEDPTPAVDLWIGAADGGPATDIEVDEDLIAALPAKFQNLARSFHFRGRCELTGRIHHALGQPFGHDQYHVRCRDANLCYDGFPVPLEKSAAELDIHLGPGLPDDPNRGDHWELKNATAFHCGGRVAVAAHDERTPAGKKLIIDIGGQRVPLGEPLAKALAHYRLGDVWEVLAPTGTMNFTSRVTLTDRPNAPPDAAVTLGAQGATVRPGFFPYTLTDLSAHLHAEGGRVLLGECTAHHGLTRLRFSGGEIRCGQGLWVDIRDIRATPLAADPDLVRALPPTLQRACAFLQPQGTFGVEVKRLVLHNPSPIPGPPEPPVLYWDGALALNDASFATGVNWTELGGTIACRGAVRGNRLEWLTGHAALDAATILRQPLTQLHAQLSVDPETAEVLQVRGLSGRAFGGTITGEGRVTFGSGLDYAMDLKLLGAQLEEFGRHNHMEGQLSGRSSAQLYLAGKGAGLDELTGRGEIDVPSGRIYDLPLALELLKAVTLRAPDGVAFDEAHAAFKIQGRRLAVERLDLLGTAVSLGGRGALDLDGSNVDLDFYAVWARIAQVLPAGWRDVPPWLSQNLLKIKMRGALTQPSFTAEPVPFVIEPAKQLLERVGARTGRNP